MKLFRAGVWHDLIYKDEESAKFWSIKIVRNTHIRKWGALGTMGDEKETVFKNPEEARRDAEKLYISKTKKGYKVLKPQLEVTTHLVHNIKDIAELNNFIFRVYGVPFDVIKDQLPDLNEGAVDYCGQTFTWAPDGMLTEYDIERIEDWINGDDVYYMTHRLLDDCVRQRLIPAGVYSLEV